MQIVQCVGSSMRETRVSRIVKKVGNTAGLDASGRLLQRDRGRGSTGKRPYRSQLVPRAPTGLKRPHVLYAHQRCRPVFQFPKFRADIKRLPGAAVLKFSMWKEYRDGFKKISTGDDSL